MKRGKAPPIVIRLSKSEQLYQVVFREKHLPEPTGGQVSWLKKNCLVCRHRNIERLVLAKLTGEEFNWKHICVHRGVVKVLSESANCSGFEKEGGENI